MNIEVFSSTWVPILTLIITVVTIIFAWRAIVQNRRVRSYGLVVDISKEYASLEMLEAILLLRSWEREHESSERSFADVFAEIRSTDYEQVKAVDMARRTISHFYYRLYLLYKNKVIKPREISRIMPAGKIAVMLELIQPLEKAMDVNYDEELYAFFEKLVGGKGKLRSFSGSG